MLQMFKEVLGQEMAEKILREILSVGRSAAFTPNECDDAGAVDFEQAVESFSRPCATGLFGVPYNAPMGRSEPSTLAPTVVRWRCCNHAQFARNAIYLPSPGKYQLLNSHRKIV